MNNERRESRNKRVFKKDSILKRVEQVLTDQSASVVDLPDEYRKLAEAYRKLHHRLHKTAVISDSYQQQTKDLTLKLEHSAIKLQHLREVALPICMYCHKIQAEGDYWERLESFFTKNVDILFSHGICPECVKIAYGKLGERALVRAASEAGPSVRPTSPAPPPSQDGPQMREMEALLERITAAGEPLAPAFEKVITLYAKLKRRFDKIVSISDSYQSQLRDFNQRLELMARTDLATGLASRWEMVNRLEIEKSRCERHGKIFSLILADVDQFKEINDTFGHLAGDRVLRDIAGCFKGNCRAEDLCVRWGGDEFVILLPETDLRRAQVVAEKISRLLRELSISWEDQHIRVSMSFGVGEFAAGNSIDEFLNRIDNSLYSAKDAGRGRVVAG